MRYKIERMSKVVGIFEDEHAVVAARDILADAGYTPTLLAPTQDAYELPTVFLQRGEMMLRSAVKWAIIGSLIIEIPSLVLLLMLPVDVNVKVFMGATVWKFGAAFGAWLGAMAMGERGLDAEIAAYYEAHLGVGRYVLSVDVSRRDRPFARGAMLESGSPEVRDVVGEFDVKPMPAATAVRR